MFTLTFFYKMPAHNINKIFIEDFKLFNSIGLEPKDCRYDFRKNIRAIVYQSKKKTVIDSFIKKGKKSKIKNLHLKVTEQNVV